MTLFTKNRHRPKKTPVIRLGGIFCALMFLCACGGKVTVPSVSTATSSQGSAPASSQQASSSAPQSSSSQPAPTPPEVLSDYIQVHDGALWDENGEEYIIYGINSPDVWSPEFQTESHSLEFYEAVAAYGMNTVRICTNYNKYETVHEDGTSTLRVEGFDALEISIANAAAAGIRVIIDMHYPPGGAHAYNEGTALFYDDALQTRYFALWQEMARRFANNPTVIGYGLCNEPVVPFYGSVEAALNGYTQLMQKLVDSIRSIDKNHVLVIQPPYGYFDETETGAQVSSGDITWGIMDMPQLVDVQNNILTEFHLYKSADVPYGSEFLWERPLYPTQKQAYADNIQSEEYFSLDAWHELGAFATDEWQTVSLEYTLEQGDIASMAPLLAMYGLEGEARVYLDELLITIQNDTGTHTVLDIDYNESFVTDYSGRLIPDTYAVDNPWQQDDRLLMYAPAIEQYGDNRYLLSRHAVVLRRGETLRVTANVRTENMGDMQGSMRLKLNMDVFTLQDASKPIFSFESRDDLEQKITYMQQQAAMYDCPVYIGEVGANKDGLSPELNYEQWFSDISEIIGEHRLGFTWHQANGSGKYGLWQIAQDGSRSAHPILDEMVRTHFMNIDYGDA